MFNNCLTKYFIEFLSHRMSTLILRYHSINVCLHLLPHPTLNV